MLIRLTYQASDFILRQTPGGAGGWDGCQFVLNESLSRCDAWVVLDSLPRLQKSCCPPERTLFITAEPAVVRGYDARFLAQFGVVLTPQDLSHPRVFRSQPAIPWWAGVVVKYPYKLRFTLDYDRFSGTDLPSKTASISLITTSKTLTQEHRTRLRLVDRLIAHFGRRLDVFGHGFRPIDDKWDALAPYRYSIVLENCRCLHYWTEKLADAFLAGTFPVYCGCPNVSEYFPGDAFCPINREDPGAAIATIEGLLSGSRYDDAMPALRKAKQLVLDRYNLFPTVVDLLRQIPAGQPRRVVLRPELDFVEPFFRKVRRKLRGMVRGHA